LVLVYPTEVDEGRAFPLSLHPVVVGRAPGCAIRIDRESISRQHARISYSPEGWCVEDLGSTNGCFINDMRVTRSILHDADFLKVGVAIFKFDLAGTAAVPESDDDGGSSPAPAFATLRLKPQA
jgi:two-component system, cell cycle response regulator